MKEHCGVFIILHCFCFAHGRIVGNDHVLNINQSATFIFACIVLVSFVVAVLLFSMTIVEMMSSALV